MYIYMYIYISISGQPIFLLLVLHLSYSHHSCSQVRCAAFSPDGRFLIFGGFGEELHVITALPIRRSNGAIEQV